MNVRDLPILDRVIPEPSEKNRYKFLLRLLKRNSVSFIHMKMKQMLVYTFELSKSVFGIAQKTLCHLCEPIKEDISHRGTKEMINDM